MSAVERPVEVELKYRVVDLAAAERYLVAEEIGSFSGTAAARSSQFEDRYVDTADGAMAKAGFAVRLRQSGRGTVVSVKSLARTEGAGGSVRREEVEGPADPNRRAARVAGVRRPLARPRARRRCAARRARDDPSAPPQADRPRWRHARRAQPRRGRRGVTRSRVVDRFVELEAELVKGAEERLNGLAEVFGADPALTTATGSKFEAAMGAVRSGSRGHGAAEAGEPTLETAGSA